MADETAKIVVDGDVSPLRQKLRQAGEDLKRFGTEGESSISRMTGPLRLLQERFVAIGAILAGGAIFKEAVAETAKFTEDSMRMGRALGISATEASLLKEALDANNTSQEEFIGAAQKLSRQVRENESDLQAMGLKTRDAAGNLRPLNELTLDAIDVLGGYKEGTDRAIAAQVAFGRGFELTSNLMNLNKQSVAELADLQRDLGAIVGGENVQAWRAYDDAGDKATLTLKAMKLAIGNALLPVLTDLSNWFSSIGPAAVTVIKGAVGGLISAFHLLTTGVTVLWETLNAMVVTVAEPIRALGESIGRALKGDWQGAKESITGIGAVISGAWGKAFDEMAGKAQSTRDRIWNLFANPTDAAAPALGGKSGKGLLKTDKDKKGPKEKDAPDSYMNYYEAALDQEKRLAYERDALRGYTKEQELAFWQNLLVNADLRSKDRVAIERKVSALIVDIKRTEAKQKMELDAESIRSSEALALGRVDAARAAAQAALDVGQLTKAQFLVQEEQFERQRYEIQRSALEERLKLLEQDPNTNPVEFERIKNQLLELEQQYQIKRIQIHGQMAQEDMAIWDDLGNRISGLWDKGLQAMMNGTLTWRNAMRAIWTELGMWFATQVVGDMVKKWLAGEAAKIAGKLGFVQMEMALNKAAGIQAVATKSSEATSVVGANAAEAASGAAASQSSIPIVGPALAIAAFAAIMGMVLGARSQIKSAAKGYDIPKGLNPMTQLHEEEMVLPQRYANVIRGLAGQGGADAGGGAGEVHIYARSDRDVVRVGDMKKLLREMGRNFVDVKPR